MHLRSTLKNIPKGAGPKMQVLITSRNPKQLAFGDEKCQVCDIFFSVGMKMRVPKNPERKNDGEKTKF